MTDATEHEGQGGPDKPPETFEALKTALAKEYDGLSKRLKQIADYALANPNVIAFSTVADIAQACGTAPSAMIRFAKALGYSGFSELQSVFQARLSDMAPSYRDRIRNLNSEAEGAAPASLTALFTDAAIEALKHLRDEIPGERLEEAASMLAKSRIIHVAASRRTFPAAFYLAYNLNRLEVPANLLDGIGGTLSEQTTLIGPDDTLVAISFQPSAAETLLAVEHAQAAGASVIVITDALRHPFDQADICFEVAEARVTNFRSLNVTMSLALILAIRTGQLCESGGGKGGSSA